MITILSTLPHYLVIFYAPNILYKSVIFLSSTLSVLWHMNGEPTGMLYYCDYSFALLWTVLEFVYSKNLMFALLSNLTVFGLNKLTDRLTPYNIYHSIWHIASAIKSYMVIINVG